MAVVSNPRGAPLWLWGSLMCPERSAPRARGQRAAVLTPPRLALEHGNSLGPDGRADDRLGGDAAPARRWGRDPSGRPGLARRRGPGELRFRTPGGARRPSAGP